MSIWERRFEVGVAGRLAEIVPFVFAILLVFFAIGFFVGKANASDLREEARAWAQEVKWYKSQPYGYAEAVYGPADHVRTDRACALNDDGWLQCWPLTVYTYDMVDREVVFTVDEVGMIRGLTGGLYVEGYDLFRSQF